MPRTLDEALRIALRLEAWVKTTKTSVQEQERTDRVKQKVRASGQQETVGNIRLRFQQSNMQNRVRFSKDIH